MQLRPSRVQARSTDRRWRNGLLLVTLATIAVLAVPATAAAMPPPTHSSHAHRHTAHMRNAGSGHWAPPPHTAPQAAQHGTSSHRWRQMSPRQRAEVRQRREEFKRMSPLQRQRVRRAYQYYQSLPPTRRQELRHEWLERHDGQRAPPQSRAPARNGNGHGHDRGDDGGRRSRR
ncbi:MAG TPA: DUF3106 domain-containing protein [Rhodanobacteraceae bacterium]|nr:DUF3106 domain-containing protein [Rhodanobacteraceae bacterium]